MDRKLLGTLKDISEKVKQANIRKTAIIAVGDVLKAGPPPALSKLYDPSFTHEYREAKK